jgi:hypothetical protein
MDLVKFLEDNWFAIGSLITLIAFTIRITKQTTTQYLESKQRDEDMKEDMKDMKKEFQSSQDELRKEFNSSHSQLSDKIDRIEKDKTEGTERTRIIMDGVEATLITLHNNGANGPVTKSLQNIQDYKSKKAAE